MDWMGKTLSPFVLTLLLLILLPEFELLSSALRPRFDIGSYVLSNTCKLQEVNCALRDLSNAHFLLSMTIDPVPDAVVTFMSVVGKVFPFCESVYVQLSPMSVAPYVELARSLHTKRHSCGLKA